MTNTFGTGRGASMTVKIGSTATPFGTVIDCTIRRTASTIEADCRDGDGRTANALTFGAVAPIDYKVEVDITVKCRADDTCYAALNTAAQAMTTVESNVGDGGFGTGKNGNWHVTDMKTSQPKNDKVTTSFTLKLQSAVA